MTRCCKNCACEEVCCYPHDENGMCCDWFPGWISVKDELPEENITVLVAYVGGKVDRDFMIDGRWVFVGHGTPAYWMPLPYAPEEVLNDG